MTKRVWRVGTELVSSYSHCISAESKGDAIRIAKELLEEMLLDEEPDSIEWHHASAYPMQDYDGEWYGEEVEYISLGTDSPLDDLPHLATSCVEIGGRCICQTSAVMNEEE